MKQEFTVSGERVEVLLSGSMHVEEASVLRERLLEYIESGAKEFRIDMAGVDFLDSSGLGVLVAIHKRALQRGGEVVLIGTRGPVLEIIELTRLNKVFAMR